MHLFFFSRFDLLSLCGIYFNGWCSFVFIKVHLVYICCTQIPFYCLCILAINIWIKHWLILFTCYSFWVEMTGSTLNGTAEQNHLLYDHRPHFMSEDDYLRVCQIPKQKVVFWIKFMYCTCAIPWTTFNLILLQGANFRNLPGIIVGADNVVKPHPVEKIPLLPSGKPLVSLYIAFIRY